MINRNKTNVKSPTKTKSIAITAMLLILSATILPLIPTVNATEQNYIIGTPTNYINYSDPGWNDPSNAYKDDGYYTTVTEYSQYLYYTGGFSFEDQIPCDDATITKIELIIGDAYQTGSSDAEGYFMVVLRASSSGYISLTTASPPSGNYLSTIEQTFSMEIPSNWFQYFQKEHLESSDFLLQITNVAHTTTYPESWNIGYVQIKIHYIIREYTVTFSATGLDTDASSSVVLTLGTENYDYASLPTGSSVKCGTPYAWAPTVTGPTGVQYVLTSANDGKVEQSETISATYQKQYSIEFAVDPLDSGAITSPTSGWFNAEQEIDIAASANSGYTFLSWSSSTTGVTFEDAPLASTKATINAAGTITANFELDIEPPETTFEGFLEPLKQGGTYKAGSTIPVKFQLTSSSGFISDANAEILFIQDFSSETSSSTLISLPSAPATGGTTFRYDDINQQYVFNLSTKGKSAGAYQIIVLFEDGSIESIQITLK